MTENHAGHLGYAKEFIQPFPYDAFANSLRRVVRDKEATA